jgi:PAS domain-containing protein
VHWVESRGRYAYVDDGGSVILRMRGVLSDIDGRKQAEEEVREANQQLQTQSEDLRAANEELQVQREELQTQTDELRTSAQALRESEQRHRSLFENMLDGYAYCQMLFDVQNRPADYLYLSVNDAFTRLTGLKDVVGKKG